MKPIFCIVLSLGLLFLNPVGVSAGGTMTLEACIRAGVKHNPNLEAARLDIRMAESDRKSARAEFLPHLRSEYGKSRIGSISKKGSTDRDTLSQSIRNFNLTLSQILYSGSRIFNTYGRAKIRENVLAAEMNLKQLELEYEIESTFYKLMKAKADLASAREAVKRLEESIHSAQAFFDRELVPYVDVLQARVDLADAREQLGIASNEVNRERIMLFSLMNMPDDGGVVFAGHSDPALGPIPSYEAIREKAFDIRPDIKSLEFQLEIARKDARIAKGKYLPVVKMDAGYYDATKNFDDSFDSRNRYWSVGVTASWNLFDGGNAFYEYQRYNIQATRIKVLIKDAKNTISTGIRRALFAMAEAVQRVKGARQALAAAEEYYDGEGKRLLAGLSTIPSLLDAQERLVRARNNYIRANLDYRLAQSELKLMAGGGNGAGESS